MDTRWDRTRWDRTQSALLIAGIMAVGYLPIAGVVGMIAAALHLAG